MTEVSLIDHIAVVMIRENAAAGKKSPPIKSIADAMCVAYGAARRAIKRLEQLGIIEHSRTHRQCKRVKKITSGKRLAHRKRQQHLAQRTKRPAEPETLPV